jgi:hypothetical protein
LRRLLDDIPLEIQWQLKFRAAALHMLISLSRFAPLERLSAGQGR